MKGERKLRLVSGGKSPAPDLPEGEEPSVTTGGTPEPPVSEEELAAADALRAALDQGTEPLAGELSAAYEPASLGEADLDAIVTRVLGDESAATAAERAAAERLRAELEGRGNPSREAEILRALKLAAHPTELSPERHEAILEVALRAPIAVTTRAAAPLRRIGARRLPPVTMAALAGVTALAAGLALFVGRPTGSPGSAEQAVASAALVKARSADDLFDAATPFPRSGQESARIDRIASARAADLRQNRFAAWGVK